MARRCQEEALFLLRKECETDMQEMQKDFAQHTSEVVKTSVPAHINYHPCALWSECYRQV